MTSQVKLSAREIEALEICLNYDDRAMQLDDNFSNGGHNEFMSAFKINRHAAAQLCGSLESKGMGWNDDNEGNGHILWLTEEGVNVIFDYKEGKRYMVAGE